MQDLSCIAMVHIRKCSYLGLLCGNASHNESILCLHGIYSITDGNASYGIYASPKDARIGSLPEQMNNAHSYIDVCPKLQNRSLRQIVVLERTQYLLSLLNRTTLDHSDIQCYLPCSKAVRLHDKAKRLGIRFLHLDTGSYLCNNALARESRFNFRNPGVAMHHLT